MLPASLMIRLQRPERCPQRGPAFHLGEEVAIASCSRESMTRLRQTLLLTRLFRGSTFLESMLRRAGLRTPCGSPSSAFLWLRGLLQIEMRPKLCARRGSLEIFW